MIALISYYYRFSQTDSFGFIFPTIVDKTIDKTIVNDSSCTSHPGVLGSIPKREEPGKTGRHPVLKYRVPHGSQPRPGWAPDPQCVMGRLVKTSPHRPRLVVSRSTCPPISPPSHANSFVLGPAVINTHNPKH